MCSYFWAYGLKLNRLSLPFAYLFNWAMLLMGLVLGSFETKLSVTYLIFTHDRDLLFLCG